MKKKKNYKVIWADNNKETQKYAIVSQMSDAS